jgi:hypothetical protein
MRSSIGEAKFLVPSSEKPSTHHAWIASNTRRSLFGNMLAITARSSSSTLVSEVPDLDLFPRS